MKSMKTYIFLLMLAALVLSNCSGSSGSSGIDTTKKGTDRFYVNFKYDLDNNSKPDFEDELKKRGLIQDRDSIIDDMVDLLWERYDNNSNRTLASSNPLKATFSSKKPYGISVSAVQSKCTTADQYNQILVVNCANMQSQGVLGMNNIDDPTVNITSGLYNERIENNKYGTSTPLGVYVDHIGSSLTNAGLFTKDLFVKVFTTVAAHEIGHGLGLGHSSGPIRYIMDPATLINDPATDFSPADKTHLLTNCLPGINR